MFTLVSEEPLEELELAPPFVLMLCLEWIVVSMLRMLNMIHKQKLPFGFEEDICRLRCAAVVMPLAIKCKRYL